MTDNYSQQSSGRWDADGSWVDITTEMARKAREWADGLELRILHWCITTMAYNTEAFTLAERKALLEVVALRLGKELEGG